MSEIVRAGIDAIDVGQLEAAKSLGMTYGQGMRRIVIPQALRVIVPPLGNEFNSMLKSSSLASAASVLELYQVTLSYGRATGSWITFMVIAIVWYLTLTTIWGFIQSRIERRLNLSNIDPGQLSKRPGGAACLALEFVTPSRQKRQRWRCLSVIAGDYSPCLKAGASRARPRECNPTLKIFQAEFRSRSMMSPQE